jgi:hypothetical protein
LEEIGVLRSGFIRMALGAVAVVLLAWGGSVCFGDPPKRNDKPSSFAVVELFTSEGCSSCPPADEVMRKLVARAKDSRQAIYCLSFHVDYWNNLGWKDPYSEADYSRRQREYVESLGGSQVYTPQMIVNGAKEFLGSNQSKAKAAISTALAKPAESTLSLRIEGPSDAPKLAVAYRMAGVSAGAQLNLAIVERGLSQKVSRGENAGRLLKHDNVVRLFYALDVPASGEGVAEMNVPDSVRRQNASLIGYVQAKKTRAIVAANALELK